jgi:hypothetical protein
VPSAYVLIICELGFEDQTVNDLAKINAESTESLTRTIALQIKNLSKFQSTLILTVNDDIEVR